MNSRLEEYMSEASKGLENLTETRRAEELAEIRHHLEAREKAHRELGFDETAAAEATIRQFEAARTTSGGLNKVGRQEKALMPDTVAAAAFVAVVGSLALADMLDPLTSLLNVPFGPTLTMAYLLYWGASRVLPRLLVGFLIGRLAPRHGVKGTLLGVSAYFAYSTASLVMYFALGRGGTDFHNLTDHWWGAGSMVMSQAFYGVAVIVAPTVAAMLGRRSAAKLAAE